MRKRNINFHLRLTDTEKEHLIRNAKKCGMSPNKYIIWLILNKEPKELPPIEFEETLHEIRLARKRLDEVVVHRKAYNDTLPVEYRQSVQQIQASLGKIMGALY